MNITEHWQIAHTHERYLRSARLVRTEHAVTLYAIASLADRSEQLLAWSLDAAGALSGEPALIAHEPHIMGLLRQDAVALDLHAEHEQRATSSGWTVACYQADGVGHVEVTTEQGLRVVIWRAHGMAAAPALLVTDEGAWVGFHHNVREDTFAPDLTKWIELHFVDKSGQVYGPKTLMPGLDRDQKGEEQGFEFAEMLLSPDGALSVFGRGSHCFWRQDLNTEGWSARIAISSAQWGCRGRRVSATVLANAELVAVFREREGLRAVRMPCATGGAPQLSVLAPRTLGTKPSPFIASKHQDAAGEGLKTFFGDIHQHSAHSDGCGSADEAFWRAREQYGDDFCALSDHESFLGKRILRGEWRYLEAVTERHNDPGKFATLFAYEWTGKMFPGPGHKVVYLPSAGSEVLSRDVYGTGEALLDALKAHDGIAVPHHVGWTGADEKAHQESMQPVWELCSCHGCYEFYKHKLGQRGDLRDQMIDEVLKRGLRFGFVAGSDGHGLLWHHGIARKRDSHRTGLTAVQAERCDRASIFQALRTRRCYATSGAKIFLDLKVNQQPMGSFLPRTDQLQIEACAHSDSTLASLALIGPAGVITLVERADDVLQASLSLNRVGNTQPFYVYARVERADGEMAWSSPVFIA